MASLSSFSMMFMSYPSFQTGGLTPSGGRALRQKFLQQALLLGRQRQFLYQVRPPQPGAPERLALAPAADRRMIATQQHRGHGPSPEHFPPRVVRPGEQ